MCIIHSVSVTVVLTPKACIIHSVFVTVEETGKACILLSICNYCRDWKGMYFTLYL